MRKKNVLIKPLRKKDLISNSGCNYVIVFKNIIVYSKFKDIIVIE